MAAQFLNIFRMERIAIVRITYEDMAALGRLLDDYHDGDGEVNIMNFGRVKVDVPADAASALDPLGRREVREILLALKSAGKTVFLNSHLLS